LLLLSDISVIFFIYLILLNNIYFYSFPLLNSVVIKVKEKDILEK